MTATETTTSTTITVALNNTGTGTITIDDVVRPVSAASLDDAREQVRTWVTRRARDEDRTMTMTSTEPAGSWTVLVHPDGTITAPPDTPDTPDTADTPDAAVPETPSAQSPPTPASPDTPGTDLPAQQGPTGAPSLGLLGRRLLHAPARPRPAAPAGAARSQDDTGTTTTAGPAHDPHSPTPALLRDEPAGPDEPGGGVRSLFSPDEAPAPAAPRTPTRKELRERARSTSLLTEVTNEAPAATGVRGALNHLGLHLAPTERERAERADVAAVAQHWAGPRTIAMVNGKGGAGKTPAVILLSAVLARYGGAGVVAYDNNSTRGTLGWRTQQGPHDATVIDLLPHVDHLLSPRAQAAEMSGFVHHQREDRYDVLRSQPEVLAEAQAGADATSFNAVHDVLAKYYRLVLVDSGNDESSPQWRAMIARADAIVVPTTTRPDHAESARLLLAELAGADDHAALLAENALVVVSQGSKAEPSPARLVSTFQDIARAAVGIPYDPSMAGRPLILDSLNPTTRRAWLGACAALADGLR